MYKGGTVITRKEQLEINLTLTDIVVLDFTLKRAKGTKGQVYMFILKKEVMPRTKNKFQLISLEGEFQLLNLLCGIITVFNLWKKSIEGISISNLRRIIYISFRMTLKRKRTL